MERYGCRIFTFDPTLDASQFARDGRMVDSLYRTVNARVFLMGLHDEDIYKDHRGWKLKTLSSVYEMLKAFHGEAAIDYLKIDIEESEWKVN